MDGERGTLVTETSQHGNAPPGHEAQHIYIPILLWKAEIATNSQFMFDQVLDVLARDAICCVDKESFVEGDAPEDGAADTRRVSFRGWMTAPVRQAYVSMPGSGSPEVVRNLHQSLTGSSSRAVGSTSGMKIHLETL